MKTSYIKEISGVLRFAQSAGGIIPELSGVAVWNGTASSYSGVEGVVLAVEGFPADENPYVLPGEFFSLCAALPDDASVLLTKEADVLRVSLGKKAKAVLTLTKPHDALPEIWDRMGKLAWKKLPVGFEEGIRMIQPTISPNRAFLTLNYAHAKGDFLFSSDNVRMGVVRFAEPFPIPFRISLALVDEIVRTKMALTDYAVDEDFVWFRNVAGNIWFCRTPALETPAFESLLSADGTRLDLPGEIETPLQLAHLFSVENKADAAHETILFTITAEELLISGDSAAGRIEIKEKITWAGEPTKIRVQAKLLLEILGLGRPLEASLAGPRLTLRDDSYTCVMAVNEVKA